MSQIIPEQYMCYRAKEALTIDGHLTEASWKRAPRTPLFVDIEGDKKPLPRFATRVAMLWDDDYFYFGADMEEPHVWGTLTKRDSVICEDNDFEIFIDPDDDGEHYMEFEINPLNAAWDLYLPKQYNRGGEADWGFDFEGIKHAVQIDGTLNCSDDVDRGWSVEVAIPWSSMERVRWHRLPSQPRRPLARELLPRRVGVRALQGRLFEKGRRSLRQLGVVANGGDQHARAPHVGICAVFRHYRRRGRGRVLSDASGTASAGSAVAAWKFRPLLSGWGALSRPSHCWDSAYLITPRPRPLGAYIECTPLATLPPAPAPPTLRPTPQSSAPRKTPKTR